MLIIEEMYSNAIFYVFMKKWIDVTNKSIKSGSCFQVTPGSKASRVNLCPGDIILSIQGASTDGMTHAEAQNKIKDSSNQLFFKIERYHELVLQTALSIFQQLYIRFSHLLLKLQPEGGP